jgi:hypothetical protein
LDLLSSAATFAVALAAALIFIRIFPLPPPANDASEYFRIARNLADGKGFSLDGAHPYFYRPPLFSYLLGVWLRVSGHPSVPSAATFQAIMHALSASAACLLFRALRCPPLLAAALALATALQPMLLTSTAFVLQEPTLLFFTTSSLLATVLWLRRPAPGFACAAGLLWGIAALGKAVTLFVLPLVPAFWLMDRGTRRLVPFAQIVFFCACFLIVLIPWTARNYLHLHRVVPVNDQSLGMLEWNVLHATPPGVSPGRTLVEQLDRQGIEGERRKEALWQYVKSHGRYFIVERTLRNAFQFSGPARDWWWERGRYGPGEARPWYWTLHDYFHRFLFLCLLYRFYQWAGKQLTPSFGFLVVFCLAYWLEHALVLGIPRFGLPVYPALLATLFLKDHRISVPEGRRKGSAPAPA